MSKHRLSKNRTEQVKTCKYCFESFVEKSSFGTLECSACLDKIEYLRYPEKGGTRFYRKGQLIVKYTFRDDDDTGYIDNDGTSVYDDDPQSETLIMLVPKILEDDDIRDDNTVDNDHPITKYLNSAGLLEGDYQKILAIRVRKLKDKIKLE